MGFSIRLLDFKPVKMISCDFFHVGNPPSRDGNRRVLSEGLDPDLGSAGGAPDGAPAHQPAVPDGPVGPESLDPQALDHRAARPEQDAWRSDEDV